MDNLRKYLENSPVPYIAFNEQHQAVAHNKAFMIFSGIGEDFLNQKPSFLGVFEMLRLHGKLEQTLDFKATIAIIEQTYQGKRIHTQTYTLPTLEVYTMTMKPLESGWIIDWQIPEHVHHQEQQRQQREMFNETSDGIILANKAGEITLINNKAHELIGANIHKYNLKDLAQALMQQYPSQKTALEKIFVIRHNQREILTEQGQEALSVRLSLLENETYMLALHREGKQIDPWQWAKEMEALKTSILEDVVNHYSKRVDIISAMSSMIIRAYAESMTVRMKNHMETIENQAKTLQESIGSLNALLPSAKPIILEKVHMDMMLAQILDILDKRCAQKRIHINYTMMGEDGWINTDKHRLQQCLHALLRHMIEQNEYHQEIHIKSGKTMLIIEDSCKKPLLHDGDQRPEIYFIESSMKALGILHKVREGKHKQRAITLTWTP